MELWFRAKSLAVFWSSGSAVRELIPLEVRDVRGKGFSDGCVTEVDGEGPVYFVLSGLSPAVALSMCGTVLPFPVISSSSML